MFYTGNTKLTCLMLSLGTHPLAHALARRLVNS